MENKTKIAGAIGATALIALSALGGAGIADDSAQVKQLREQVSALENVEPVVINNTVIEKVPVPYNVSHEVFVDNGNLDLVLEHVYDNNGNVEYLIDDLDDDEVGKIVERIVFINDIKALAVDYVRAEGIEELDKELVNGTVLDEDDVERFKIDDEADEVLVSNIDFEDSDAEVFVRARFEHDDVDYEVVYRVEFEDGKVEDISIDSLDLR